ncbi:MAG: phosphoglycerate mutase family protein [Actinomycetota bacterium]|nr:phosphoglycerate mutase family protein [Actinomycetota bacterium]
MEVLLVRHAHAGAKDRWSGDDRLRPLSARGRGEALALVELLAPYRPRQVLSSPLLRCVQTVQPLAAHLGLPVETSEALGPRADRDAARLVRSLASGTRAVVVCTHGETIEALQRRLARPGHLAFGPGSEHEKGSVWVLGGSGGRFADAIYLRPGQGPRRVLNAQRSPHAES